MNLKALINTPWTAAGSSRGPAEMPANYQPPKVNLNEGQQAAVEAMQSFVVGSSERFFVLEGPAGTGKTFCIKELVHRLRGRLIFTAPTNKATKVLRESVTTDGYRPECRTIYSLLGLRLEANGEVKELAAPEDPLDLSKFVAVVVDEASMINANVMQHIKWAADNQNVKFIFMGDPAQLPPVKETSSPVWTLGNKSLLTKVMRHDNAILKLATAIRLSLNHPAPSVNITTDNDGGEGIWKMGRADFITRIREYAAQGHFSRPNGAKAIAWRNVTVDEMNACIRAVIFDAAEGRWAVGDRIVMLEPAEDLENEPLAHTDEEGTVQRVNVSYHPLRPEWKCYALTVGFDDNKVGTIWLIHDDMQHAYNAECERMAAEARAGGKGGWRRFWEFKDAFHSARHAYAITAHRAQGSTYDAVFVDYRDILLNRARHEAFRCLYVACTRPKKELYLA